MRQLTLSHFLFLTENKNADVHIRESEKGYEKDIKIRITRLYVFTCECIYVHRVLLFTG